MADGGEKIHGLPDEGKLFNLSQFKGLNTRSPRMSIDDQELSWIENFFPIAPGNLRTMWGIGSSIYTAAARKTVVYFFFYNLSSTQYCAVFLNDGTAYQVNVLTLAVTTISAAANKFYAGTTLPVAQQYGNQYLLIANTNTTNDYWIWDGSILYGAGSIAPFQPTYNLTQGGTAYASAPSVSITGGTGTGAAATATITNGVVTSLTVTNAGANYVTGDTLLVSFSGGTPSAGVVSSITILNGGSNYVTAPTLTITGGGGSSATATCTIVGGAISTVTITVGGSGFTSTPTVTVSAGNAVLMAVVSTVAVATVSLMPFGNSGNEIEMFLNRVHMTNKAKVQITDPGSLTAFNTTITSSDSFLRNSFTGLKQTNGFIYLFADSSINDVTNESTSGTPAITTLNNSNADPQMGTPWRDSIECFGRDIIFANSNGIYVMYGGAAEKISDALDGIFASASLPITGYTFPSSAVSTVFGIKIYMILLTVFDPFTNTLTPKLICYDGKKFFIASQEVNFTYIATQEQTSLLTAWGTDGTNIYPIFNQVSSTLVKKGQTKLWSGESHLIYKQAMRAYLESYTNVQSTVTISTTIDNETNSTQAIPLNGGNTLGITNNGNVYYILNGGNTYGILSIGFGIQGVDAPQYGLLMGFTFTTTSEDFTMVALSLLYKQLTFYG